MLGILQIDIQWTQNYIKVCVDFISEHQWQIYFIWHLWLDIAELSKQKWNWQSVSLGKEEM